MSTRSSTRPGEPSIASRPIGALSAVVWICRCKVGRRPTSASAETRAKISPWAHTGAPSAAVNAPPTAPADSMIRISVPLKISATPRATAAMSHTIHTLESWHARAPDAIPDRRDLIFAGQRLALGSVSMTSPLSDSVTAQIAGFVEASQRDGRVPGVSVGVVRNGQVIHGAFAGRGLARDTQSRIGSISKTFTATLLMQLRDAGVVDLDAPLSAYLPALDLGPVTVRQVLAHFSGLRREPHGDWWERAAGGDVDSLLADVDGEALIHRPMRRHHYSNLGYGLLGAVIEKVTGDTWWDA